METWLYTPGLVRRGAPNGFPSGGALLEDGMMKFERLQYSKRTTSPANQKARVYGTLRGDLCIYVSATTIQDSTGSIRYKPLTFPPSGGAFNAADRSIVPFCDTIEERAATARRCI